MFTTILKRADGFPEGRKVGEESPRSFKIRRPFLTVLAMMVRCIGRGCRRSKWLIAAGTRRLPDRADRLPTHRTEEGHWVCAERGAACEALDRQDKPEGLTAPSDESIPCIFM